MLNDLLQPSVSQNRAKICELNRLLREHTNLSNRLKHFLEPESVASLVPSLPTPADLLLQKTSCFLSRPNIGAPLSLHLNSSNLQFALDFQQQLFAFPVLFVQQASFDQAILSAESWMERLFQILRMRRNNRSLESLCATLDGMLNQIVRISKIPLNQNDVFCVCLRSDSSGFMIECDLCSECLELRQYSCKT